MSIRPGDRVSFILSGLSREQQQNARRRTTGNEELDARSAAAVAGACSTDVESFDYDDADTTTPVHANRESLPKLKNRRACCTTLVFLWTMCATAILFVQLANLRLFHASEDDAFERRLVRDESIHEYVAFGIWDSHRSITKLQLQVCVSVALGVRASDGDVTVEAEDNYFFRVAVDHATIEEVEYISSVKFFDRLNAQLLFYGGLSVLSKPPKIIKNSTKMLGN